MTNLALGVKLMSSNSDNLYFVNTFKQVPSLSKLKPTTVTGDKCGNFTSKEFIGNKVGQPSIIG
jgi:hypothetical protein